MKNPFLLASIEEAEKGINAGEGGPFGAVVVRRGTVLARAHNEVLKTKDPTAHAEVLAIRKAARRLRSFDLSGCAIYSTCEPCPMCLGAIAWARIESVVYGCTAGDAARIGFSDGDLHSMLRGRKHGPGASRRVAKRTAGLAGGPVAAIERHEAAVRILGRKECLALFNRWSQMPGRRLY